VAHGVLRLTQLAPPSRLITRNRAESRCHADTWRTPALAPHPNGTARDRRTRP
jgi:hypothetical protein